MTPEVTGNQRFREINKKPQAPISSVLDTWSSRDFVAWLSERDSHSSNNRPREPRNGFHAAEPV